MLATTRNYSFSARHKGHQSCELSVTLKTLWHADPELIWSISNMPCSQGGGGTFAVKDDEFGFQRFI